MWTSADQTAFRSFKAKLTRRTRAKDWTGVIDLWREFESFNWSHGMPDDWRKWERAAEDARFTLDRERAGLTWSV